MNAVNRSPLFHSQYSPDQSADSASVEALIEAAERAMKEPLYTVVDKTCPPAGGDKRHYTSLAKYWWPNPSTSNGLPYVRRDGVINPEIEKYDINPWSKAKAAVMALSSAAAATGRKDFAKRASEQMATWFLNPETRMIPHLHYAQFVPGMNDGRPIGIIEWSCLFPKMLEDWVLIAEEAFTEAQSVAFDQWCGELLDWLLHSDFAQREAAERNNHAVHFDVLAVYLCLWLSREEEAAEILKAVPSRRIDTQIEPDGRMPHELARTKSFSYTIMNLFGFCYLATLGEHIDIDLWSYESADGRSLRKGIEFLFNHMKSREPWPYEQLGPVDYSKSAFRLIAMAERAYGAPFDTEKVRHRLG